MVGEVEIGADRDLLQRLCVTGRRKRIGSAEHSSPRALEPVELAERDLLNLAIDVVLDGADELDGKVEEDEDEGEVEEELEVACRARSEQSAWWDRRDRQMFEGD